MLVKSIKDDTLFPDIAKTSSKEDVEEFIGKVANSGIPTSLMMDMIDGITPIATVIKDIDLDSIEPSSRGISLMTLVNGFSTNTRVNNRLRQHKFDKALR